MRPSLEELAARLGDLASPDRRTLVGIAGPPGAGKSTLAEQLAARTGAVAVPMDGFHLGNAVLRAAGALETKGAPSSFDAAGFVALLQRLRSDPRPVPAPVFDRALDEPVADALVVPPGVPAIVEGNYLLLEDGPWAGVRRLLDEVWYLQLAPEVRLQRLIARHVRYGRDEATARLRATIGSDGVNARLVEATAARADLTVHA